MTLWRADDSDDPIPALELPARIGWHPRYTGIVFDDPPYLVLQATPVFPC